MSNFSNSGHHHPHDSTSQHNNAFFNDNSFGGYDGLLNNNAGDVFDSEWAYNPAQFHVSGNVPSGWDDAGSQQHVQPHTFRPGAHPDQVFASSSLANISGNAQSLGYTANDNNAFTGFPSHPPFNTSNITPSNLNNQQHQVQVRVPAPSAAASNAATIAPEALQSRPAASGFDVGARRQGSGSHEKAPTTPFKGQVSAVDLPSGTPTGNFAIIGVEFLRQRHDTRAIGPYVEVGNSSQDFPISKGNIPPYYTRKSRNEIKRLLASDSRLKAKLDKKISKKSGLTGTQTIPARLDSSGKLTTQSKKDASSSSEEETTDSSEYESSDDEAANKPPVPLARPNNPNDATRYDTIKCLWRPRDSLVSAPSIRDGLKGFHEIISTIKERWSSDRDAVKEAESNSKMSELPLLKDRVKIQRDMLEVALKAACEHGHPDIVDHFGTSPAGIGLLTLFLHDRAQNNDHSGGLVQAILEFLSRSKLLDHGSLEKSRIGKLLPRFSRRGDEKTKALVRRIESNAVAASRKKKEPSKAATSSPGKDAKPDGAKSPAPVAGLKRQRPTESATEQPIKKVAGKAGEALGTKKPAAAGNAVKSPANATNKTSSNSVVAKSTNFISSLQSAKRPQPAKPASGSAKAAPKSSESKASGTGDSFSFASVLADVSRPKEQKPKEQQQDDRQISETPEEKAKRLRKEARRGLRVSFRPEESLVEVRVFEHDPEEELGHDLSQMRDVNDVKSEGKMFKLHQQHHEMLDIEDDDEDHPVVEQTLREWGTPSDVDFQEMPEEARSENYVPYGGGEKEPTCPEKRAQESREATTLLAVYATPSDIPPSPHEPSNDPEEMAIETKQFGELPSDHMIYSRIEEVKNLRPATPPLPNAPSAPQDISSILSALSGVAGIPPVPQMQVPQAAQATPQSSQDLASILSSLPNMHPQQQQAPAPPMGPQQQDMAAILNAMNQSAAQPQQSQPQPSADISSILASLQQSGTPQPQPQQNASQFSMPFMGTPNVPGPPMMGNFNTGDQGMLNMLNEAHQFASQGMPNMPNMWQPSQPQQQQFDQPYENEQRKRMRDQGGDEQERQNKFKKNNSKMDPSKFFQVQCKYFKEGKCMKGAACTYRHDDG